MSARPFQVGDRVRITVRDVVGDGGVIRVHTGTIRSLTDMTHPDTDPWVTLIADVDEPYLMGKSSTMHAAAITHLTADRTRSTWPASEETELEPVYLELDGVVMKTTAANESMADLLDYGWEQITRDEAMSWQPLDDDGTEAESLAEVSVPAFPDVLVHGRAHASAA